MVVDDLASRVEEWGQVRVGGVQSVFVFVPTLNHPVTKSIIRQALDGIQRVGVE